MYQAAELETVTLSCHSRVPNTPQFAALPVVDISFYSNSRLSRYYKPVHPSPLAFILLSLDFFFFALLCLSEVGFHGTWSTTLRLAEWIAQSPAGTHWHTNTIRPNPCQAPIGKLSAWWPPNYAAGVNKTSADTRANRIGVRIYNFYFILGAMSRRRGGFVGNIWYIPGRCLHA